MSGQMRSVVHRGTTSTLLMGLAIWFRQVILHAVALHKKGIWCPFSVDLKQRLIKFFCGIYGQGFTIRATRQALPMPVRTQLWLAQPTAVQMVSQVIGAYVSSCILNYDCHAFIAYYQLNLWLARLDTTSSSQPARLHFHRLSRTYLFAGSFSRHPIAH